MKKLDVVKNNPSPTSKKRGGGGGDSPKGQEKTREKTSGDRKGKRIFPRPALRSASAGEGALSPSLKRKLDRLRAGLRRTGGCAVAYSGGVDSSVLLAAAHEMLGDRCLAVIGASPVIGRREQAAALDWLRRRRIPRRIVRFRPLADQRFTANSERRCYYCKRGLFEQVKRTAATQGLTRVAEGSNADDRAQIRPGRRAAAELGVLRPLERAGLRKSEIRELARTVYRLPMAEKPSASCLATRVAFGLRITPARLRQAERMEDFLHDRGFRVFRARIHPGLLRLEFGPLEEKRFLRPEMRRVCTAFAKKLGFAQITLDLQGFRSGSAHERAGLPQRRRGKKRI